MKARNLLFLILGTVICCAFRHGGAGGGTGRVVSGLIDDGLVTGTHPDFNQFNPTSNDTTQQAYYDTWINVIPPVVVGSQGTTIGDNSDPVVGLNYFDNNTLAATGSTGPAISYWYRIVLAGLQSGATVSVQGNYADVSNAYGFDYGGDTSASVTFLNNFDMVNHVLFIQ